MNGLDAIPTELWIYTFQFLQVDLEHPSVFLGIGKEERSALESISLSCRAFRAAAQPLLFPVLNVNLAMGEENVPAYRALILSRLQLYTSTRIAPQVRAFGLNGPRGPGRSNMVTQNVVQDIIDASFDALTHFTNIHSVELVKVDFTRRNLKDLSRTRIPIPVMRTNGCGSSSTALQTSRVCVTKVSLQDRYGIPIPPLMPMLLTSGYLRELTVTFNSFSTFVQDLSQYAESIASIRKLEIRKVLSGQHQNFEVSSLHELESLLPLLTSLESFSISGMSLDWESTRDNPLPSDCCPTLQSLSCMESGIPCFSQQRSIIDLDLGPIHKPGEDADDPLREGFPIVHKLYTYRDFFARLQFLTLFIHSRNPIPELCLALKTSCIHLKTLKLESVAQTEVR
jgi:hypothetical protein